MSSFRSRILWLLLALVVIVQASTVIALVVQTNRRAADQAGEDLRSGGKVVNALLQARAERLQQAITLLATDYGFREAVTASDRDTIISALENSVRRVDARVAALIDADSSEVTAANQQFSVEQSEELQHFAGQAGDNAAMTYRMLGNAPYMLVSAPVRAPTTVATVVVGFPIDQSLAQQLSTLVGYEVGFVGTDHSSMLTLIDAQNNEAHTDLLQVLAKRHRELGLPTIIKLSSEPYMVQLTSIGDTDDRLQLLLQKPLDDALQPYTQARSGILIVALIAMLLAIPLARILARQTSKPLEQLVAAAKRIESGNYAEAVAVDAPREFLTVATTLNSMQNHIAEREERIRHQAISDELTGLPNRDGALALLDTHVRTSAGFALVLLAIKDFDRIRASLGHHLADNVVREVANRLVSFRGPRDQVARIALAQFLFVAPELGAQSVNGLARTLLQSVRTGLICNGVPINLDAHLGLCVYPTHARDAQDLLRRVDTALYDAQERGEAISIYEPGRDERHRRQLAILGDLRRAADSNELHLVYQPKVDMKSQRVCGLEALLRWTHPVHGPIPPSEFVPLAEKTGNVTLLTSWVLRTVLRQMSDWQSIGFLPDISINLSAADLLDRELTSLIMDHVRLPEAQPQRLIFEITESAVMRDTPRVIAMMERLRRHKVRFSIDDFGTGYSSLAQFKHLPVDEIKIDRSFVLQLASGSQDAAIVRSTIDLGHNFGVKVVAEGVETSDSWRTLADLGCDFAQGYLISAPLPVDQVINTVESINASLITAHTATQQVRAFLVGIMKAG